MILSFHIEYRTSWGEEVRVLGSILELGNNQPGKAIPLQTVDGIHWTLDADIQAPENGIVQYSYHIYRDNKNIRTEWNSFPRRVYLPVDDKKVCASMIAGRTFRSSSISIVRHSPNRFWHTVTGVQPSKVTKKD